MPSKENLKSARKMFQVMVAKNSIIQLQNKSPEEIEAGLQDIHDGLVKTFGVADATEILESAIKSADETMTQIVVAGAAKRMEQNS